jgi:hypothetical protein
VSARAGFALPAVFAALVIMAMVVAVGAQRSLVGARESALLLARAEMSGAVVQAMATVLTEPVDSARLPALVPGALLDSGSARFGSARATWTLTGLLAPYATAEIDARAPVISGSARELSRVIVSLRRDSSGALWWVLSGGDGRGRVPAP